MLAYHVNVNNDDDNSRNDDKHSGDNDTAIPERNIVRRTVWVFIQQLADWNLSNCLFHVASAAIELLLKALVVFV